MNKRRLGALIFTLMLAITTLGICISISSMARAPGLDPRIYVEAHATATAIAPAIVPTVRYNEVVLPTRQAEEANQITATVRRQYENARAWNNFVTICKKIVLGALVISSAVAVAGGTGVLIGAFLCYIIERAKRAHAYEPIQVLPDRALYYPRHHMLTDPRTGMTWEVTTHRPACVTHGTILVERQIGPGARFRLGNGERHPQMIEALRNG